VVDLATIPEDLQSANDPAVLIIWSVEDQLWNQLLMPDPSSLGKVAEDRHKDLQ
jgi:hypothetical protein